MPPRESPPRRYFPVDVPHRMPGAQSVLGAAAAGARWIERDAELDEYLEAKRRCPIAVERSADARADDERMALDALRRSIVATCPEAVGELAEARDLDALVGTIQEDVVLMRRRSDGATADRATAVYLNVSFPTGWCPPCVVGRSFLQLHGAVPVLHDFGAARGAWARHLFDTTCGPTVRFVWTLTPDPALDRRRCAKGTHASAPIVPWSAATTAYFRVERQVLVPLHAALGIFLVRIYRRDVRTLTADERARLAVAVAAMEPALARYKGFAGHEETLLRLLA